MVNQLKNRIEEVFNLYNLAHYLLCSQFRYMICPLTSFKTENPIFKCQYLCLLLDKPPKLFNDSLRIEHFVLMICKIIDSWD